jgi:hypothetical protein
MCRPEPKIRGFRGAISGRFVPYSLSLGIVVPFRDNGVIRDDMG